MDSIYRWRERGHCAGKDECRSCVGNTDENFPLERVKALCRRKQYEVPLPRLVMAKTSGRKALEWNSVAESVDETCLKIKRDK
jgi:hypothetical protein